MRRFRLAHWTVPALFGIAAASTGVHTIGNVSHALTHPSSRLWLVALYGLMRTGVALAFAVFTVGRTTPTRPSRKPLAFLACAVAIAAVMAFADPAHSVPEGVVLSGELVAVAFCVWLLVSVLFLGRCFGVLPEARGLVTAGPYRLVRHPVYLGEIGACAGLALAAPSAANAGAFAALVIAQAVRMRMEERALTQAFPQYAEYAARTPRLVPRPSLLRTVRRASTPPLPANWTHRSEPAVSTLAEPTGPG